MNNGSGGKKVLILGCGKSGVQAANLMLGKGREVVLFDSNEALDTAAVLEKLTGPAEFVLGELPDGVIDGTDLAVISPGISIEAPFAVRIAEKGVPVISEIEAAYAYEKGTVIGITGTNGKTTTTTLVGEIMKAHLSDEKAFTAGNIGVPYAEVVLGSAQDTVTVIELSSFQLESVRTFRPHVSAILNITPDHLDRHHTMECYTAVKERISENQDGSDFIVLNHGDQRLRAFGESLRGPKVLWFSGEGPIPDGYYLSGDALYRSCGGVSERLLGTEETTLVGRCNDENILAAVAIADAMGVPIETTLSAVRAFRAVAHRIEFVEEVRGVRYYDDSKGTNPDAAIQGIRAMTSPTVLLGGGYDKGSEFDDWIEAFDGKVKLLILMGVTREKIADCARRHGFTDTVFVDSMEEAVKIAAETALPGENVLLSPACASWGMFKNYEERGDIFKALVREMKDA